MNTSNVPVGMKKAAALCILRNEGSFLLLRRSKEPHLDKYIPVGGRVEPFETPKQAALREVKEETNITILEAQLRGIMTETSPTKFNWINYVYTSDIDMSSPEVSNEGTLEWIKEEQLDKIPAPETDRYIYDYVARGQFFVFDAVYNEDVGLITLVDEITGTVLVNRK